MNNIEIEYRSEIPIGNFDKVKDQLSGVAELQSHKRRFSVMLFMGENNSSILYIRTTKDVNKGSEDTEMVHKKGAQASYDRIELTQKIDTSDFESYVNTLCTLPTNKTLVMQRETLNFFTSNGITVSLVKAKNHAYLEFEKLSSEENKDNSSKEVLELMGRLNFKVLDESKSMDLFNRLDTNDDRLISGTQAEIESVLTDYQTFSKI